MDRGISVALGRIRSPGVYEAVDITCLFPRPDHPGVLPARRLDCAGSYVTPRAALQSRCTFVSACRFNSLTD